MTNQDLEKIRSLSYRRRIEGMTRQDKENELIVAFLEAEKEGLSPARCLRKADGHLRKLAKRREQPTGSPDERIDPIDPLLPDCVLTGLVARESFDSLLSGADLTPREEEVIRLTFFHNTTDEDISEALGVTIRRVQQYRSNALGKIRIQNGG